MRGRTKIGYIIGAVIIGVIAVLAVYFALIGFGVVDYRKEKLIFVSDSAIKEYDGEELRCHLYKITEGKLKEGHTAEVEFSGTQTEVGTGNNSFTVVIKDSNDKDVTENYIVELQPGTLTVNKREIVVQSHSAQRVYNGEMLKNENADIVAGSLVEGHRLSVSGFASTDKGTVNNTFVAAVLTEDDENVTALYNITYIFGDLVVSRIPISLRAVGAEKEYDGVPLTDDEYVLRSGILLDGHYISDVTFVGSQLYAGTSEINITSARVIDDEGNDWSDVYDITFYAGELTVTPRPITIVPKSAEKEYDGEPLTSPGGTITSGALVDGDSETFTSDTFIVNAGEAVIDMTLTVTNEDGIDVSDCYDVSVGVTPSGEKAKLVIKKRELVLESGTATHLFDGRSFFEHTCTVKQGSLVEGHILDVTYYTEILHVGTAFNEYGVAIYCDGETVTDNYELTLRQGRLTVSARMITVISGSANKVFDDTPLTCHESTEIGELAENHFLEIDYYGEITEIGSAENYFIAKVFEETEGVKADFTDDYYIIPIYGTLTVYPRPITITSETKSREYRPGETLYGPNCTVELTGSDLDALVGGHTIMVYITGSQTEPGQSPNTVASVVIYDEDKIVNYNYNITVREGLLTVFEVINDSDLDEDGRLDGEPPENVPVVQIMSTASKAIYLRLKSFGIYDGKGFSDAEDYESLIDGKYSANYLTGEALKNGTAEELRIVSLGTTNYLLPYYMVMGGLGNYAVQTSDVYYDGDPKNEYTLTYYPYDYTVATTIFTSGYGGYTAYGSALNAYAHKIYLSLDGASSALKNYLEAEAVRLNFSLDDPNVIRKIANYIKSSATYDKKYDRELNSSSDVVYDFLTKYKSGVCRHYAAAATLMYRTVGIPARYTIGYKSKTKAGEWVEVTSDDAHAWVEVFIDGIGWVEIEVTGSGSGDNGNDDNTIYIKPKDVRAPFISKTQELRPTNEIQGLHALTQLGYSWDVTVEGLQIGPGESKSHITYFVLYDPGKKDVTDKFDIVWSTGIIQIYLQEITLKTESHVKNYDGDPFEELGKADDYTIIGELGKGYSYLCTPTSDLIKVGSTPNSYTMIIKDENGIDVTCYYRINYDFGDLTILPYTVIVKTGSKEWSYFDDPPEEVYEYHHFDVYYEDGETPFPHGEGADFFFTMEFISSLTYLDSTDNEVRDVRVYNKYFEEVTDMFSVVLIFGRLEVGF